MAAAPADFRAAEVAAGKLAREGSLELRLEPTEDILAALADGPPRGADVVGFAAEHGEGGVARARAKLDRKGADLIVLNDVSDPTIGFESAENAVTLIDGRRRDRGGQGAQGRDRRGDPRPSRSDSRRLGVAEPVYWPQAFSSRLFPECREVGLAHFFFGPKP